MRTKIRHFYGSQDNYALELIKFELELDDSKEQEALEKGWSLFDGKWFQSRLTRIKVSEYDRRPAFIPNHTISITPFMDDDPTLDAVYEKYVLYKNFEQKFDIYTDKSRASLLKVHCGDELAAFTKFINYDGAIESQFTAWDYRNPKLSIGRKMVNFEVDHARGLGHDFLYIGPGYGESSAYKSQLPGFEWWTGESWSTDKDKYTRLCKSDSSVRTLSDLSKLYNEFED